MLIGRKISRGEALKISREILEKAERERNENHNCEVPTCPAFLKYPKDKWRLLWVLDHDLAESEMTKACLEFIESDIPFSNGCPDSCGRWMAERIAHIKRLAGIFPVDKNVESLREMLERVRNMSVGEYQALYDSLPEVEE